jgi:hypothetical protein
MTTFTPAEAISIFMLGAIAGFAFSMLALGYVGLRVLLSRPRESPALSDEQLLAAMAQEDELARLEEASCALQPRGWRRLERQ